MMMGFGMGGVGVFLMLIFWLTIVGAAIWVLGRLFPGSNGQSAGYTLRGSHDGTMQDMHSMGQPPRIETPALEILAQRYARGEITTAEYEEMRRTLGGEANRL